MDEWRDIFEMLMAFVLMGIVSWMIVFLDDAKDRRRRHYRMRNRTKKY